MARYLVKYFKKRNNLYEIISSTSEVKHRKSLLYGPNRQVSKKPLPPGKWCVVGTRRTQNTPRLIGIEIFSSQRPCSSSSSHTHLAINVLRLFPLPTSVDASLLPHGQLPSVCRFLCIVDYSQFTTSWYQWPRFINSKAAKTIAANFFPLDQLRLSFVLW